MEGFCVKTVAVYGKCKIFPFQILTCCVPVQEMIRH